MWALVSVLVVPFRFGHYIIAIITVVLGIEYLMRQVAGIQRADALWYLGNAGVLIVVQLLVIHMLINGLIKHFGDKDDS